MSVVTLDEVFPNAGPAWIDGLEKEFRHGWELEKATYMARQVAAQKEVGKVKNVEGLGQLRAVIDGRTYFRWMQEDPHFWEDRSNFERFIKDNPECRAPRPEMKTRITV